MIINLIKRMVKLERQVLILRCGRVLVWMAHKLDGAQIWCIRKARKCLQKLHESE